MSNDADGRTKLDISGTDPIIDPLSVKHSYGAWEKYEPLLDFIPSLLPQSFETMILNPLAQMVLVDPKRDTLILRHIIVWTVLYVPLCAYFLYCADENSATIYAFAAVHFLMWFTHMDTYVLGLHVLAHKPVFKSGLSDIVWQYYSTLLGPLFGETPETYYVHHIGMHHIQNNYFTDLSSTMAYKRDSFYHWCCYFLKFLFCHRDMYKLMAGKNTKLLLRFFAGEIGWLLFTLYHYQVRPLATLFVLVAPVLIMRLGMMAGNWGQHAFINPNEPTTNFGHSINIINSKYNTRCFNDGYHIIHHLYPSAHYTELPSLFASDIKTLAEHDCIVFSHRNWDFAIIWFYLMIKDYDTLARHYVNIGQRKRSHEEIVQMLKDRCQKVYDPDVVLRET
eukprot:TRINITY_DN2722_c0_g1_i1.p1 TRINITY_DN2722_c0_g1~~TRINITY_DN2722_c0_g1_i1.p1  ORF type:complete len:392 (+),score=30.13 TRINITY_DN2722_c0_g1_i1:66-1241(+)